MKNKRPQRLKICFSSRSSIYLAGPREGVTLIFHFFLGRKTVILYAGAADYSMLFASNGRLHCSNVNNSRPCSLLVLK